MWHPKIKWISIEDALPTEDGLYQVLIQTNRDFFHPTIRYFRAGCYGYWHRGDPKHCWKHQTLGVFAWAPIPKKEGT